MALHILFVLTLGLAIQRNQLAWRRIKVDMQILEPKTKRFIPAPRRVPRKPPPDKILPEVKPKRPEAAPPKLATPRPLDSAVPSLDYTSSPFGQEIGFAAGEWRAAIDHADAVLSAYKVIVNQAIQDKKRYPMIARKSGWQGSCIIEFSVFADGSLNGVSVKKSSGYEILDEAALKSIRDAAPFPPPPVFLQKQGLKMEVALVFNLH